MKLHSYINEEFKLPNIREYLDDKILGVLFNEYVTNISEANGVPSFVDGTPDADAIMKAINERYYVGIYYKEDNDDVLDGFRLIEPYVYGTGYMYNNKLSYPNRQYLRAFVVKSSDPAIKNKKNFQKRTSVSKTKRIPYWRLFRIDRIDSWQLIPRKISQYRELYNPADKMIANILLAAPIEAYPKGMDKLVLPRSLRNKQ
jgi:hypothetical protein